MCNEVKLEQGGMHIPLLLQVCRHCTMRIKENSIQSNVKEENLVQNLTSINTTLRQYSDRIIKFDLPVNPQFNKANYALLT